MYRLLKTQVSRIYSNYLFFKVTKLFKKRYSHIDKKLLSKTVKKEDIIEYKKKWKVFGQNVEIDTFLLCYNLSGILNFEIVPENIFACIIEKKINNNLESKFQSFKNIYNKWFICNDLFPSIYFHKIDGVFYNNNYEITDKESVLVAMENITYPIILKASVNTSGGIDVVVINSHKELVEKIDLYDSLVSQEKIIQNNTLSKINNSSVNSVRVCLFRLETGKFVTLNTSIRFGVDGSLDNETAGGIVCNINENGGLNSYAVDKYAKKFYHHPNSGVLFEDVILPNYEELVTESEKIANEILFCNLVSLDMCLDINNKWRCIEINLNSQTIRFAQYAGKGFFGSYTDNVIKKVINKF